MARTSYRIMCADGKPHYQATDSVQHSKQSADLDRRQCDAAGSNCGPHSLEAGELVWLPKKERG